MGSDGTYLLGQRALEDQCLTDGYTCYPICVECLGAGKSVVRTGENNKLLAQKERRQKARKNKK